MLFDSNNIKDEELLKKMYILNEMKKENSNNKKNNSDNDYSYRYVEIPNSRTGRNIWITPILVLSIVALILILMLFSKYNMKL